MFPRYEEDLDSPCTRYTRGPICSGCKKSLYEGEHFPCYRAGRSVKRVLRYRESLASIPSHPRTIWDQLREGRESTLYSSFTEILKRIYGPKYEGPYTNVCLAKELEKFEERRYSLRGHPKPRKWKVICEKLGLKLGKDPLYEFMYRENPFFNFLRKDSSVS